MITAFEENSFCDSLGQVLTKGKGDVQCSFSVVQFNNGVGCKVSVTNPVTNFFLSVSVVKLIILLNMNSLSNAF